VPNTTTIKIGLELRTRQSDRVKDIFHSGLLKQGGTIHIDLSKNDSIPDESVRAGPRSDATRGSATRGVAATGATTTSATQSKGKRIVTTVEK